MESRTKRWIFGVLVSAFLVYSAAVYTSGTHDPAGDLHLSEQSSSGKMVFQQNNCIACHQIYGLGGYLGPDLTNVVTRKGEPYVRAILQHGAGRMPDFGLQPAEIDDLLAFFKYIDKTGQSPVTQFEIRYDGTVQQR